MTPGQPGLTVLDLVLTVTVLALAGLSLTHRSRAIQATAFLGLGVVMSLLWLRLGSVDVALAEAARSATLDPVLAALVITGLVVTVAFTGVGAVLIHRIEAGGDTPGETRP